MTSQNIYELERSVGVVYYIYYECNACIIQNQKWSIALYTNSHRLSEILRMSLFTLLFRFLSIHKKRLVFQNEFHGNNENSLWQCFIIYSGDLPSCWHLNLFAEIVCTFCPMCDFYVYFYAKMTFLISYLFLFVGRVCRLSALVNIWIGFNHSSTKSNER